MATKNVYINKNNELVTSKVDPTPVPDQRVILEQNENKILWNVRFDPGDTVAIIFQRKPEDANDQTYKKKGPFKEYFQKEGIDLMQFEEAQEEWDEEKTGSVQHAPDPGTEEDWKFTIIRTKADGTVLVKDPFIRIRR